MSGTLALPAWRQQRLQMLALSLGIAVTWRRIFWNCWLLQSVLAIWSMSSSMQQSLAGEGQAN